MIFLEMISRKPLGLFLKICTKHFIFCTKTIKSSPRFFPNVESFFHIPHSIFPFSFPLWSKEPSSKKRRHKTKRSQRNPKNNKNFPFLYRFRIKIPKFAPEVVHPCGCGSLALLDGSKMPQSSIYGITICFIAIYILWRRRKYMPL